MRPRLAFIVLIFIALFQIVEGRQFDWTSSFVIRANYITSSKLFFNPDAATNDLRSQYITVDDMVGAGLEWRWRIEDANILVVVSADYISKSRDESQLLAIGGSLRRLPVTEGVRFIPLELGINTYIPIGSENMRLTMGGGFGAYYAIRTLEVAGVGIRIGNTPIGYGIHVGTGVEYKVNSILSLRMEMKFRDPEIVNEISFEQESTDYGGSVIVFPQNAFRTKIQVDGLSLSLGLMVEVF
ncbi:MAG: hypothetical protein HY562_05285 [Ignavibacteriales bacterium]|nr:hypothetical protein [Ignavibacteriales bacterium]